MRKIDEMDSKVPYWCPLKKRIIQVTDSYVIVNGFRFDKKTGLSADQDNPWCYIERININKAD